MSPLVTLSLLRLRGRFRKWLRMVKQPKYAIGMLIITCYWAWLLLGRVVTGGAALPEPGSPETVDALRLAAALGLAAMLTLGYLLRTRQPLVFDESEIQHLFTAPLARRTLIRYALLKVQPGILIGSGISSLIFARGGIGERLVRWPSVWLVFTLMFLWSNAVGLWKARMDELPPAQARRRRFATWAGLALAWSVIGALAWRAWLAVADVSADLDGSFDPRQVVHLLAEERLLHVVLAPLQLPLQSILASSPAERGAGWLAALAIAVLLTEACARSPVRFEEGALERARQVSEIRAHGFGGRRARLASAKARLRRPFPLQAAGPPETAILWKNLLLVARTSVARVAAIGGVVLAVAFAAIALLGAPKALVIALLTFAFSFAILTPVSGGAFWRNDLRVDLLHVDQLRTWPLPAWRLVAAEVAAPALATAAACAFLLALGLGTIAVTSIVRPDVGTSFAALAEGLGSTRVGACAWAFLAALPLATALSFLSAAIQNATVLLLPGWSRLGRMPVQGAAIAGQQVLLGLARLIVMAVGLLPGIALVAVAVVAQRAAGFELRAWELPLLGLLAAAPLALESLLIVRSCGLLWDRLDPSRELLEGNAA